MIDLKTTMSGIEVDKRGAKKSSNANVPAFSKDSRMHQYLTEKQGNSVKISENKPLASPVKG